ncbi:hypothetical protein, partial [Bradyrhizobium sp. SZCCHNPS1003]|uniref:hypothetical protein n=1 Tax=Bradyrhizobium sp. SZCCHNPS1003 TaxID=3057330 RepID=UPI0028F0CAE7
SPLLNGRFVMPPNLTVNTEFLPSLDGQRPAASKADVLTTDPDLLRRNFHFIIRLKYIARFKSPAQK